MHRLRSIIEWAAIIAGIALAYPFVKSGGSLDQAFGPWWLLAAPVFVLLVIICAWGRLWGISAGRQTGHRRAAEAPSGAGLQQELTAPAGQTVH